MFPYDALLAAALLSAPPDAPPPALSENAFARLQPSLHAVALSWEVMDPREVHHLLRRHEALAEDVRLVRRRCRDLLDAPPLGDGLRFPNRSLVSDLLAFNKAYRDHLVACRPLDPYGATELNQVLRETDRLYQVWDTVRDARCDYYYVTVRRAALKKLRQLVGEQAYARGDLPPHVPVWRFRRID